MGGPQESIQLAAASAIERSRRRYGAAIAGANFAGAVAVALFLAFALPNPHGIHHVARLKLINLAGFVVIMGVGLPLAWMWSRRLWGSRMAPLLEAREPTGYEQQLILRFPLTQQGIAAVMWITASGVFTAINAPSSWELAGNVGTGIVLGGLITCTLGYLLAERLLRPVTAALLAGRAPVAPQLPGVRVRALLTWTLGTGVVLTGLAMIGVTALYETTYGRVRLAILMLVLSVIGLVIGLLSTHALARSLAEPISALRRGLARVQDGDLEASVPVDDAGEIGLLQAGFNHMVEGLRERERLRDLFGRQVGEEVARVALERGVELGGESREAAILFVDIEGSTTLAMRRDPAEVVALLNRFFGLVVEEVAAHGGWVNKFEGDAALCVWGAPAPDPGAAGHALATARTLAARLRAELPAIRAGIGVSAGRVVAGNVGAASRFEYTVIGDPVNEAARLTELAKQEPSGVVCSAEALRQAGGQEADRWLLGEELQLRGRSASTVVATPA